MESSSCYSAWHSWKSCSESVERCDNGYCVIDNGILILVQLTIVVLIFSFSAIFAFIPELKHLPQATVILKAVTQLFVLIFFAVILIGITFTYV
jgi:hypothetical protein